jgi:hypothetical protein
LPAGAALPPWAAAALASPGGLVSVTRTGTELSLVVAEAALPEAAGADSELRVEGGFRALQVAGPLDFSLTGVLAALAAPLAAAGLSLFAVSTFDTDYLLVRDDDLAAATAVLRAAGHRVG